MSFKTNSFSITHRPCPPEIEAYWAPIIAKEKAERALKEDDTLIKIKKTLKDLQEQIDKL